MQVNCNLIINLHL
uniref:Uncharacterized protein n=1 Tax=Anguilla anguilla TaxID=7936 RepID=A0A0E9VKD5_ANGAN